MSIQPVNKAVEHLINPTAVLERGKKRRKKSWEKSRRKKKKRSQCLSYGGGGQGHSHTQSEGLARILWVYKIGLKWPVIAIVQELCESRGGRPGLSVLTRLLVSVDVKNYWTVLRHWSQLVPNMSTDIWGYYHQSLQWQSLENLSLSVCLPSSIMSQSIVCARSLRLKELSDWQDLIIRGRLFHR